MRARLNEATAKAYCSTANVGPGFDCFGLALDAYSDSVNVRITQGRKIRVVVRGRYGKSLPREPRKNSAGPPALALLKRAKSKNGLVITIDKNVPQGLGLGSSGATAAACTRALDYLLGLNLTNDQLVQIASLGERAVAGTAHPDNVGASLLGDFVIIYDRPFRTVSLKSPSNLAVAVAIPQLSTRDSKTRKARLILPKQTEIGKAVLNIGRASTVAVGFALGNISMIGSGMEDELAEPYRSHLIPGYNDVRRLAKEAGAAGVAISGAGPSMIALVDKKVHDPRTVARAMIRGFTKQKVRAASLVVRAAPGAKILRMN